MTLDGKRVTTTRGEAVVHRLVAEALKGDHRSIKLCLDRMGDYDPSNCPLTHEEALEELAREPEPPSVVTDEHRARALAALLSRVSASEEG